MKIGFVIDWWIHATSLNVVARNIFRELAKLMLERRDFVVAAIKLKSIGLGDVNKRHNVVHIPNMGGYRFVPFYSFQCKNLIVSPQGIDEVILGERVFRTQALWNENRGRIEQEVQKWKMFNHNFKAVHVLTNSEKEQMNDYLGIPEEKMTVIPLGVNHDVFKPPLNKLKIRKQILGEFYIKDSPYFIHVSETNYARKNTFRILEAFRKAKQEGIPHKLIIVGKQEPEVTERVNSTLDCKALGFVSEEHLTMLYQGADALVLPSLHEGFGLPIIEAMACGTPAITSHSFSPAEIVGDAGILVDPYYSMSITKAMLEIVNSEHLREDLSRKSLERTRTLSWRNTALKLLDLYRQNASLSDDFDFDHELDLAALRTMVTIFELNPQLHSLAVLDLLKFDYSRMINWALHVGTKKEHFPDYFIPLKEWLDRHSDHNTLRWRGNL